jgi:WD40 repeat protein
MNLALSPDGKWLAAQEAYAGTAHLWELGTGKPARQLGSCGLSPTSFSPDGKLLALGITDDAISLYDPVTG